MAHRIRIKQPRRRPQLGIKLGYDTIHRNPDIFNINAAAVEEEEEDSAVSAEVQAALDLLPNPDLEDSDKLAAIIDPSVIDGTWDQIDYLFNFAFEDEDNGLTNIAPAGGVKLAVAVNAPTHTGGEGFLFNGTTQYLQLGIIPSTDLTNATLNDMHVEFYVFDNLDAGTVKIPFGARDATQTLQTFQNTGLVYTVNNNDAGTWTTGEGAPAAYADVTRYGVRRTDSTTISFLENGIVVDTEAPKTSLNLPVVEFYVGCRNSIGTADLFINAKLSYWMIGGGFNLTNLDSMLDIVETQYGL